MIYTRARRLSAKILRRCPSSIKENKFFFSILFLFSFNDFTLIIFSTVLLLDSKRSENLLVLQRDVCRFSFMLEDSLSIGSNSPITMNRTCFR